MKRFSRDLLAKTVHKKRKELSMTQLQLATATGIHRTMISRMEKQYYVPSIEQLEKLGGVLQFDVTDLFIEDEQ